MLKINYISKTAVFTTAFMLSATAIRAQAFYSLQQAVDTALKKNFDIQLVRNDFEIAKINNTPGNAGALPFVTGSAANTLFSDSKDQRAVNGTTIHTDAIPGNTLNAGISTGIVLFNGFRIAATKQRLYLLQQQSEIMLNRQIQSTIADVTTSYFDLIRQKSYLAILQNSLDVSSTKLEIVNERNKVGMANSVDLLMAQTDVNSARQGLQSQASQLEQARNEFLTLINATSRDDLTVENEIVPDTTLSLSNTLALLEKNELLAAAAMQTRINEQKLKETAAQRYPSLKLTGAYSLANTTYNSGNTELSRTYGPEAGIGLQVPIYNGNVYKSQQKVADINVKKSVLEQEQLRQNLIKQATNLHTAYQTALEQLKLQKQNYQLTQQLVAVVMENFRHNQATILEVKAAQTSLENAGYQLVNMQYAAKIAETDIKLLTSSLLGK